MPKTTVRTDLLQPLEVVTELGVDGVGQNLAVLAIDDILLSVKEPSRDFELCGVLDNGYDTLKLIGVEFARTGMTVSGQKSGRFQMACTVC